jgi:methionyl-tRNA synthetase
MGTCPKCGNEEYGDQCEKMSTLNATDLINQNRQSPEKLQSWKRRNTGFAFDRYEDFLKEWILLDIKWLETKCIRSSKIMDWRRIRASCAMWLRLGIDSLLKVLKEKIIRGLMRRLAIFLLRKNGRCAKEKIGNRTGKIQNWFTSLGKTYVFIAYFFQRCWKPKEVIFYLTMSCQWVLNLEGNKLTLKNQGFGCTNTGRIPNQQDVLRYALTSNAPET